MVKTLVLVWLENVTARHSRTGFANLALLI